MLRDLSHKQSSELLSESGIYCAKGPERIEYSAEMKFLLNGFLISMDSLNCTSSAISAAVKSGLGLFL